MTNFFLDDKFTISPYRFSKNIAVKHYEITIHRVRLKYFLRTAAI